MKLEKQIILNSYPTKNGRVYTPQALEAIKKQINSSEKSRNLGALEYPEDLSVSMSDVAFTYSNAIIENGSLCVDIEILSTPMGEKLKESLEVDKRVGISRRVFRTAGQATLDKVDNFSIVGDDYQLMFIASVSSETDALKTELYDRRLLLIER